MLSLPTILLILAALSLGATIIAVMVALRSQREASSAIFPIVREEETLRAQRARLSIFVWMAITALFLGGWLATLRQGLSTSTTAASTSSEVAAVEVSATEPPTATILPLLGATNTSQPQLEPSSTATEVVAFSVQQVKEPTITNTPPPVDTSTSPTLTPVPVTSTFTSTPEPSATVTPTPVPTDTPLPPTATLEPSPTPTPTRRIVVPQVAATTPPRTPAPEGIRVGPIQFATKITSNREAIDPQTTFPKGTKAIYAVYQANGMRKGLPFRAIWYQNGAELAREEGVWQWGSSDRSFTFFGPPSEGLYKLELYVNDSIVATNIFEIK